MMKTLARVLSAVFLTAILAIGAPAEARHPNHHSSRGVHRMHGGSAGLHHGLARGHRGFSHLGRSFGRSRGLHLGFAGGHGRFAGLYRRSARGRGDFDDRGFAGFHVGF